MISTGTHSLQNGFNASEEFKKKALISDPGIYETAEDRLAFWAERAATLSWFKTWDTVLEWNPPFAKWFDGGKINAAYNCLDRHLEGSRADKKAIIFEGENGDTRELTYQELYDEVCKFANVLRTLGVKKGDVVTIYMPMIPEAVVAMLACARIGAPHSVVFGGFSPDALRDRINDAHSKIVITADGSYRRGKILPLKENVDEALQNVTTVEKVIIVNRTGLDINVCSERDFWYHDVMKDVSPVCPAEETDAEDILFILYTSGTTGKPKGVVHTTGGYLTGVATTHEYIFDIKDDDVYWCTADIGWITGHSYLVYGPLTNGTTVFMFEGTPDYPEKDRYWELVSKYGVTILYTAPTAIRTFMKWGQHYPEKHNLSSLRLLGSVGEPINPEAWMWYYNHIGGERCPIVDTWWQTETGMIMITPLPGITEMKPGSCTVPFPGIKAEILNRSGQPVAHDEVGYVAITEPWPAMLRTIYGDDKRYKDTYWGNWPGRYFAGDGAKVDGDGYFWIIGRVDDVINVSGHRIGTAEVESALVEHSAVAEAACIGKNHDVKGQAIAAFVTLREGYVASDILVQELKNHVAAKIGAIARPDEIHLTPELPKTRSGKIIRRILRDIAEGRPIGDTTTLADESAVIALQSIKNS
ncbi:acetate--CoA ligase [Dehalobacter sp. DCM]|uniref:acetate--CoA ligase n=1 Tax=Dehalobacter sp. DCM TaxID=2907827 RepID=UPI003081DEDD|nr:acetate--CoA ligase [Dehalobacter sp. DCM]